MMRVLAGLTCAAVAATLLASCGSEASAHHEGVEHGSAAKPAAGATLTPAQQAYAAVNTRMHAGMQTVDPDPDVAFAQGMIVHHQGAVDSARVQLQYGRDPEMRRFAQGVIDAQTAEIGQLNAWLVKRGKAVAAPVPQATSTAPPIMDHSAH